MDNHIQLTDEVSLSRIVAGCMRFAGANLRGAPLLRFVEQCIDLGVDTFDHAPVYGGCTVEEIFGDSVLYKRPGLRSKIKLITKTGITLPQTGGNRIINYNSSPHWISAEVERSLRKLGADHIDLLLIHRPDPLMDPSKTGAVLEKLVKSGKVLSVGVSNFTTAGFSALQSKMAVPLAVNQIELSAKTTEPLFNGTVDNALERNLPLMAWSPLGGGGLFLGQDEQSIRLRHTIGDIAEERKVSPETILYAWLLCLPVTVLPITGTTRIGRLRSAVAALDLTLTRDEWYRVLAASRGFDVP